MARGPKKTTEAKKTAVERKVTRYTYEEIKEPRTPETGHTSLIPSEEQVVTLPMDNGWSEAIEIGKLEADDPRPVVIDMDPAADPVLFWAGKRNRREVPLLPLQRNEIVTESRIAQIIERTQRAAANRSGEDRQGHLFAELEKTLRESDRSKRVEFYTHDEGWKNKLICGDSLHVMESALHYENLRGKVQMIYIDPPYGIKYDSNFQQRVDAPKNDGPDGGDEILAIKAFRDTWTLGIHSYLSYARERLYLCRELLSDSGSIFFQISDTNVHHVRELMDEVFGASSFVGQIAFTKTTGQSSATLSSVFDYLLWYARDAERLKYRQLYKRKIPGDEGATEYNKLELTDGRLRQATVEEVEGSKELPSGARLFSAYSLFSAGEGKDQLWQFEWKHGGQRITTKCPKGYHFKTGNDPARLQKLVDLNRLIPSEGQRILKRYLDDFPYTPYSNLWTDTRGEPGMLYSVQTAAKVVQRCILMTSDPGDIVFDPTCGSGTTAFAAERTGRRWITCDTSRVAINVARKRLLSATFEHYQTRNGSVGSGFIYATAPQVTLKCLVDDLEPEQIELFDQPQIDSAALRVCGPFEVASLGRYSLEDWKGYVVSGEGSDGAAKLENYIEVICRLYRKDASVQNATGFVHAVAETQKEKIAISVGPLSGRVTGKQINDAIQDALASGILEVHLLGWAFEANVGEVKSQLEKRGKVKIELIMIRPDTLAEGLKATQPEMLFSPLALPDIEVEAKTKGKAEKQVYVTLKGVALFDRKRRTTEYKAADSGYVSAWYLDEDYDGDCFVDCQMFFDFKKAPNIKAALKVEVDADDFTLKLISEPFPPRQYKRIAVKVVDVYGNESTVVRDLEPR
jgi:adenine-specific DNA-methyltransferase